MAELGWIDYTLPSRGRVYGSRLPDGKVQIRTMTAREQAKLSQQGGGIVGKVNAIVNACVRLPEDFGSAKQLILTDRFSLLLAIRTKTFGPVYEYEYRCGGCGDQVKSVVNIVEDLDERTPTDDFEEPFAVLLPDSGKTVRLRLLRGIDEDQIVANARRIQMQSNDPDDPSYLIRVAMQLVSVDEEEEPYKPLPFRQRFIENLSAGDLIALEDAVNDVEPGIDTRVYPACPRCEYVSEISMPFVAEFFRPKRRSRPANAGSEHVLPRVPRQGVHEGGRGQHDD
jgi:hypothetical protein